MEWVQNPDIDKMIDDGARAPATPQQQAKIYKDLQQKLIDDQPDVFLETQIVRHAMDKCLTASSMPMQSFDYAFHKYSGPASEAADPPLRGKAARRSGRRPLRRIE